MSQFKVGDKVKIPNTIDKTFVEERVGYVAEMAEHLGKVGIVKDLGVDGKSVFVQVTNDDVWINNYWWPTEILESGNSQQKPWRELVRYLAEFSDCDGNGISWRKISRMTGVPKSTASDFLRKLRKQGVLA